jgi:superfamily II DNA or RNA helicase
MRIKATNLSITFQCDVDLAQKLDAATSPIVKGCRYNRAFRQGLWDGREHLVKRLRGGGFTAPVGLLPDLLALARDEGLTPEVEDARRQAGTSITLDWDPDWRLRPYQREAVEAATADRGLATAKGLLRLPTRSGKTVIAAGVIDRLKVRTLFLVQSEMLLSQTIALFQKVLRVPIGKIGSGAWEPADVTVASCQTLSRRAGTDQVEDLFASVDLVIFDECHHLEGKRWREVLEACDAPYKLGLSATIWFDKEGEVPRGDIWVRAATGPVLYSMEPSDLIRMGYLMRPLIRLIPLRCAPVIADDYQSAYKAGIIEHAERNALVAREARKAVDEGLATLVVTSRLEHVATLEAALAREGLKVGVIVGPTPPDERRERVAQYIQGSINVLLGTVFGEGVDIPKIECVINAEGGQSKKATMQRFRNLTPAEGKEHALFIDFMDTHSKWLAKHSRQRLKTYRENDEFDIVVEAQ